MHSARTKRSLNIRRAWKMSDPTRPGTTALVSSQNPSIYGQSVTFTVTVSPQFSGTPAGTVEFYNGTKELGTAPLVDGVASFTSTKLAVGTGSITAKYFGNGSFLTSTSSALSQVVN
jgi:hypothetical protein